MKLVLVVSGLALALPLNLVKAQVTLDVSKITCDQYVGYKITDPRNIAIWLSGYYNAKRGNTVIDTQAFNENARKLQNYCLAHPEVKVMDAVEVVFGGSN
jgi:acid stress chaperone HdeB